MLLEKPYFRRTVVALDWPAPPAQAQLVQAHCAYHWVVERLRSPFEAARVPLLGAPELTPFEVGSGLQAKFFEALERLQVVQAGIGVGGIPDRRDLVLSESHARCAFEILVWAFVSKMSGVHAGDVVQLRDGAFVAARSDVFERQSGFIVSVSGPEVFELGQVGRNQLRMDFELDDTMPEVAAAWRDAISLQMCWTD